MTSKVMDLIYWKDMERTGMVFTGLVVGLLSVFQLSIITVVSTLCLAIMCLTISIRIYYKLLHALQLGDGVHPFKTTDHTMDPAVIRANYRLLSLKQEDRPVEDHISDFLALAKVTDFPDSALVVFFRDTLHVSLRERLPPAMRDWTLHDFLEATLLVCGSPYTVGFAEKDPTSPPTVETLQPSGAPPVTPTPVCKPEPTPALASEPEVTPTRNSVPASPVAFHEPARPTSSARRRERRRASASPPRQPRSASQSPRMSRSYLDLDISLSGEEAQHYIQRVIVLICSAVDTLRNLFFVGNLFNSLKFFLLMYLVTFLGNLCNGLTLLIIGVIAVFSVPLFYRRHQNKVDSCFVALQAHIDNMKDFLHRLTQSGGPLHDSTPGGAKPKAH